MIAALVRHLVESTVFASFVAIFPFLMRKRGAAARHTVWLLAASKFAVPVALFSAAGIQLRSLLPANELFLSSPSMLPSVVLSAGPVQIVSGTPTWVDGLILAVWFGGSTLMLALWLRGFLAPVGASASATDSEIEALTRMRDRIGLRSKVALLSVELNAEPAVKGVWRLTITIPKGLSTLLAPREFESVLLHELAHARRRDNLTMSFVHVLVCLFWFHPLLWWIERRMIAEQELACDEIVLRRGPTPDEYASGLLKICRFHLAGALAGVCGIGGSNLKSRMEAIMSFNASVPTHRAPRFLVGAILTAMTVAPLVIGFFASNAAYAQPAKSYSSSSPAKASKPEVTCDYGKAYPQGTVIQVRTWSGYLLGQQMCVENPLDGHPLWIPTNAEARERSQRVVNLQEPRPIVCKPAVSHSLKYCACQDGIFSSIGAIADSASGKIRCDKGKWRAATLEDLGLRKKN